MATSPIDQEVQHILGHFPRLTPEKFNKTSDATLEYNCLAWALHDTKRRWDPDSKQDYWPSDAPQNALMVTLIGILKRRGFELCPTGQLENGFEKIAIYSASGGVEWDHVARQLPNGLWTSKIGHCMDISHGDLESLTESQYGDVKWFLKRPVEGEHDGQAEASQTDVGTKEQAHEVGAESLPVTPAA